MMETRVQHEASFERMLSLGHQKYFLFPHETQKINQACGTSLPTKQWPWSSYADEFFTQALEVKEMHSIDYSDYEGSEIVHDLNTPLPDGQVEPYDVVFDGGTLEHVYNFPMAVQNCMKMVKVGGHLFLHQAANNLVGHGFYQFSPELIYRLLDEQYGFRIRDVLLIEHKYPGPELYGKRKTYRVIDPARVHKRVSLSNPRPVLMIACAEKIAECPIQPPPIQSDYIELYKEKKGNAPIKNTSSGLKAVLKPHAKKIIKNTPYPIRHWIKGQRQLRHSSFANPEFYERIDY